MDLSEIRIRIERLISEAKLVEASAALKSIQYDKLPRAQIGDFANFARRIGNPELTLRVLRHVREPRPGEAPATPFEIATYAMALGKTGATDEAIRLFESIRGISSAPEADLYLAFTLIRQWKYREAIPWLENYLKRKEPTSYQKTVAKLNLAAAYEFTEKIDFASQLAEEIAATSRENGWARLQMNALEISSQLALESDSESSGTQCEKLLDEAFELAQLHQLDTLTLKKWKAVKEVSANPKDPAPLRAVREHANELGRWEIVRDCDYQLALITGDPAIMSRVYFGTPFSSFRKRIIEKSGDWFKVEDFYDWHQQPAPTGKIFDLLSGMGARGLMLQLMRGLSSDFYRPLHVGNLHALLYPEEFFNPIHSPAKIKNLVTRIHRWFDENEFPFRVTSKDTTYRLQAPYSIRVYLDYESRSEKEVHSQLEKLRSRWPYKSFSSSEAAKELQITLPEAVDLLKDEVASGRLYRSGRTRSTLFRFRK